MIARKINLDFADVPMKWARIPEFSLMQNAGSPIASQSEIFVNGVMAKARSAISPDNETLLKEMDIFVEQESNHCALHYKFNKEMYRHGYQGVKDYENKMRIYYRDMLKNKSIEFCAAYCAGFENIALFSSKFAFECAPDLFQGGDERMEDLFKWHLAEEFEHRNVAHALFKALSGNYFLRLRGAWAALRSLKKFQDDIYKIIIDIDRQSMSAEERRESIKREKAIRRRMAIYIVPRMLQIFLPFYDPDKHHLPKSVRSELDRYEKMAFA